MILCATTDQQLPVDTVDRPDTTDADDIIVGKPRNIVYLSKTPYPPHPQTVEISGASSAFMPMTL